MRAVHGRWIFLRKLKLYRCWSVVVCDIHVYFVPPFPKLRNTKCQSQLVVEVTSDEYNKINEQKHVSPGYPGFLLFNFFLRSYPTNQFPAIKDISGFWLGLRFVNRQAYWPFIENALRGQPKSIPKPYISRFFPIGCSSCTL